MRRFYIPALAVLLTAIICPCAFATARPTEIEPRETIALELEQLFVQLTGSTPTNAAVRRHGRDLYSMSVAPAGLEAAATSGSQFRMMAVGQQTSTPTSPRSLFNSAVISTRSILNFWWAVYNGGDTDRIAPTKVTVRGAGRVFLAQTEDLDYPAGKITIYWAGKNQSVEKVGFYTVKAKVAGAGSRKTSFMAE